MARRTPIAQLLAVLDGPGAIFSSEGVVLAENAAFARWAESHRAGRLERRGEGAWLVAAGIAALPVRAEALVDGRWLVLPAQDAGRIGTEAVVTTAVRRLERLGQSMEANLSMALRERPGEAVSASVREALSSVEELRGVRRLIEGLFAAGPSSAAQAVNLPALTREAVLALSGSLPVRFEVVSEACVVRAVREQLFAAIAALVGALCRRIPDGSRLSIVHQAAGDRVRLVVRAEPPFATPPAGIEIEWARLAVGSAGGRLLVEGYESVVLELPAFETGGGKSARLDGGTVLIADDDPSMLAMMGAVLRQAGFSVIEADNGVAACSLVRMHGAELGAVVTDAVLPGCSGLDVIAEVRRSRPDVPVLLITGHDEDLVPAVGIPMLRKPFAARTLRQRVARLLEAVPD